MTRRKRQQPAEITNFRTPKITAGGSGDGGSGGSRRGGSRVDGFRPGQTLVCKILKAEPGGYAVTTQREGLPGYLPSNAQYKTGDELLATFVCIDRLRVLLSERFGDSKCSFCARSKVKKLIVGPKGTCICDNCLPSFVSVARTERPTITSQVDDELQSCPSPTCCLCARTQDPTDELFAFQDALMCEECLQYCKQLLAEHLSVRGILISAGINNRSMEFHRCLFCRERFNGSDVYGNDTKLICRACVSDCLNNRKPEEAKVCSFCDLKNGEWSGSDNCWVCRECLEFGLEIFRGQDEGPHFYASALDAAGWPFSELEDSAPGDPVRCTFCEVMKETCCELFPGSQSQICDRCYEELQERNETGRRSPCAHCQSPKTRVVGPGFALCAESIEKLLQLINEVSEPPQADSAAICSMCRLITSNSISFAEQILCAACIERFHFVVHTPPSRPKKDEVVSCRVVMAEEGGYAVLVGCSSGFLATRARFKRGTTIAAKFFCWFGGTMMLTPAQSMTILT